MTWEPRGGWARTPPAPLLEVLEVLQKLAAPDIVRNAEMRLAYRHAAQLLEQALTEEYAPS